MGWRYPECERGLREDVPLEHGEIDLVDAAIGGVREVEAERFCGIPYGVHVGTFDLEEGR
jgi:hypothetical protein